MLSKMPVIENREGLLTAESCSHGQPLALVAWGCKLEMAEVDEATVRAFIREKALKAPGSQNTDDGQFDVGLMHRAEILAGSDIADSVLCPNQP